MTRNHLPASASRLGAVVLAASLAVFATACDSDDADPPTTPSPTNEDGAIVLPQNPSLKIVTVDEVWAVENDGNVTMSDVEVRNGSDVVCDMGTLAPGDQEPCADAEGVEDVAVYGVGPQGQEVELSGD